MALAVPRLLACIALCLAAANAFRAPKTLFLQQPRLGFSSRRVSKACVSGLRMQTEPEVDPRAWQPMQDPETGRTYYVNPVTGESAWERPSPKSTKVGDGESAPKKIYFAVDEEVRDERWNKFQKIMEIQKEQDEIKKRSAGFVGEGRKFEVLGYALLLFGIPTLFLAIGFSTGTLPNPFEVCTEGGTTCQ
mmetsp:Transcript_35141/g.70258  ORF Transcript_35141/g.70258 Transcript_35141/m.70258 type:complete len:191 (-) Transcript_35141:95-667(-)